MPSSDRSVTFKARWVFPVAGPPIEGGTVTIAHGRIGRVGGDAKDAAVLDLGEVAILPGFVNAHTHLEFSGLKAPLGAPGMKFPDWIREVIDWRKERDATEYGAARRVAAFRSGLSDVASFGSTVIGEVSAPDCPVVFFANSGLDCTVFHELIGLEPDRHEPLLQSAREHVAAGKQSQRWRPGVSPHAPYTAPLELVADAAELSKREEVPLAMHLAESWEEIELLRSGSGPFFEFLASLAASMPAAIPRGLRPLDYLERMSAAERALVIHGNYLDDDEIAFLAEHAERMSVVFCPRTHAYFGHGRYPLETMLERGVRVALGTDSRASNPDLNLFAEMRFVAERFPSVSPATVLAMGTQAGAAALGLENECGILAEGRRADFAIVRTDTASEMLHPDHFFGSRYKEGRLDFRAGDPAYEALQRAGAHVPTVLAIFLDRPAVLTGVQDMADVILANFVASDAAVIAVVLGEAAPRGRLPFELPRSMQAVEAQDPAV
ncbi:MAG: amidohydrolase family protein, partial [Planctomycetes bacterium]|nr:amidohydrolase family protein [Planctomycetota bacterium]